MKKLLIIIILLACTRNNIYAANIDTQIKAEQKSQSDMQKKIQQYNALAKKKSQESKNLLSQLSRLKQGANDSQVQMQGIEKENARLEKLIADINAKIAVLKKSISEVMKKLRARLVDMYKFIPEENNLSVIFASRGAHEAVNTAYMLRRFARGDMALIDKLYDQQQELIALRKQLEESKSRLDVQAGELRKKRSEYDSSIKKTDLLLKDVQSEQKKAELAARELENAQKAVGNKINALMKQKKNAQKSAKTSAQVKTQPQVNNNNSNSKKTTPAPQPSSSPKYTGGALSWPVKGTVTMQYGNRVHPTFKTKIFNSGIDIRAGAGTAVRAAAGGEVLYQGWLRGFGQVVIIDHGGDLSTVYAHLGGSSVREGASVQRGAVIGTVGNTGTGSEYGLHFEVRKGGSAQDPMKYLR